MDPAVETAKKIVGLLKEQYGLRFEDLLEAYEGVPTIPATAFMTRLTPLETAAVYLHSTKQQPVQVTAKLLHRSTSVVNNALANAQKKKITPPSTQTPFLIPTSVFSDSRLSPAEAVVVCLRERYRLDNSATAHLLGRDPRNTWHLYKQACKKRGEQQ